jgi:hypothetical protein
MKAQLLLVVSPKMDANRKQGRNEDGLIRLGSHARENLGLTTDKSIELWPDTGSADDRINRARALEIFEAYKEDLKGLKNSGIPEEEYLRSGFVTSKTFEVVCRDRQKKKDKIWIADSITDTVIGGDPEFMLFNKNGKMISASRCLEFVSDLGNDGHLAELRPKPATTPKDFVKNIESILKSRANDKKISNLGWMSGCYYKGPYHDGGVDYDMIFAVGGHIHFGTPVMLVRAMEKMNSASKLVMYQCMKKTLDEFVAIPCMRLDGMDESTKRRDYHNYGALHDIRTDHGRLEWRTLSGMWMSHPVLAKAVLGASKAVSHAFFQYLEKNKYKKEVIFPEELSIRDDQITNNQAFLLTNMKFEGWSSIPVTKELGAVTPTKVMYDILHKGLIEFKKTYFTKLRKMFESLSSYKEYKEEIDMFLEVVSLPAEELEGLDRDIKAGWLEKKAFIVK